MKNIIIVEGITDKKFLESYIAHLQTTFPQKYFLIPSKTPKDKMPYFLF